ncbi:MAG: hypothetical protein EAX86_00750 [Candidatus Heimdallarchaeota archaeon]|nr:hypothetical protein [Candidatus Heimdallarchaeota archaeon]
MVFSHIAESYFDEFPFRRKDSRRKSSQYFFLSHAHSDHLSGIKYSLSDPDVIIVCSDETSSVIRFLCNIPKEKCLIVNPNQSLDFDDFIVHAIDANHCVGSLMYVIESKTGLKEIYTGDFRMGDSMRKERDLLQGADQLWLDNTYGADSRFDFPSREEMISQIVTLILSSGNFPERDIWIASYQIGKELLLRTVSQALKVKITASELKERIYKEIGGEWDIFTSEGGTGVYVDSRRVVENLHGISEDNKIKLIEALRISPTGWSLKLRKKAFNVHFFPYSDHCSYSEIQEFINLARAKRINYL